MDKEIVKALLDWPFLGFLLAILIIIVFNKSIRTLIERRKIKFKYGDAEISLDEIPDVIEKEIDSKLDISNPDTRTLSGAENVKVLNKIKELFKIESNDLALIIFYLGTSKYTWRNLDTLAKRTSFKENKIAELTKEYQDIVKRSYGKTGNVIYRLDSKAKLLFDEKIVL